MTSKKKSIALVLLMSAFAINLASAEANLIDTDEQKFIELLIPNKLQFPNYNPNNLKELSKKDIQCLETVVFNETRGNKAHGAVLVGATVINRANSKMFPNDICKVAYQPKQFSNIARIKPNQINQQTKSVVEEIVHKYYAGQLNKRVLFFHADYVKPSWAKAKKRITKVGAHIFYGVR